MSTIQKMFFFTREEDKALDYFAKEVGVSQSEFLRLIIKGLMIGKDIIDNKEPHITIGDYGYGFDVQEIQNMCDDVAKRLQKAIKVDLKPIKPKGKMIRYKSLNRLKNVG